MFARGIYVFEFSRLLGQKLLIGGLRIQWHGGLKWHELRGSRRSYLEN